MQDTLFAVFLFILYFSFACCLLHKSPTTMPYSVDENNTCVSKLTTDKVQVQNVEEELQFIPTAAVSENTAVDTQPELTQDDFHSQVLAAIDSLGKREARRLCSPLKIQQKRNGIELSTELMLAAIRKKFKSDPDRVIAVIGERLPKLLAIAQQQLQQQAGWWEPKRSRGDYHLSCPNL